MAERVHRQVLCGSRTSIRAGSKGACTAHCDPIGLLAAERWAALPEGLGTEAGGWWVVQKP